MSSPQIFLLYSLTSRQDLASLGDAYAPHFPPSKVSHPGGNVHDCFTGCDGLAEKKACSRVGLLSIKVPRADGRTRFYIECDVMLIVYIGTSQAQWRESL